MRSLWILQTHAYTQPASSGDGGYRVRAIVFGGSGFIGTHLTASLVERGYEVVIADLAPPAQLPTGASYEECDVRQQIELKHNEPYDAIYNLAAIHRTPGHAPHEYYETNIFGAQNVTDWAEAGGGDYICFTSSISVYGPSEEPKDESSPLTPSSDYGRSKLIAESTHRRWQKAVPGRRLVVVRPAVVFGRGEHGNFTRLANALAKRRFMYPGRTDVIKACGYVGELVNAIQFIEDSPDPEITFNFCYPERYTIEQICRAFNEVAGYRLPRIVPQALMTSAMRTLRLANPSDRGSLSAARVAKLTLSTNIIPTELVTRAYPWTTDVLTGLQIWRQESVDAPFA